jgi:hypothetical protein
VSKTYSFTATGASELLQFDSLNLNAPGYDVGLDKVSIASATAVPEPGTLSLLGLGLAALGFTRRRKTP